MAGAGVTEGILYALAAGVVFIGAWLMKSEAGEPTGPIPPAPLVPVADDSIRADIEKLHRAVADIQKSLATASDDGDDHARGITRQLDRIERTIDRICDRMDTDARLGSALAQLNRTEG